VLKLQRFLPVIFAAMLASVSILGCVQGGASQKGYMKNDDCLFCHVPNNSAGVADFSRFYTNNDTHHKVGISYPLDSKAAEEFNLPSANHKDMAFFDRNGNGRPDIDEIRVYMSNGIASVTCESCHREHERSPVRVEHPDDDYLRGTNTSSEMCTTCHRK
jgi:hypothetical protein